MMTKRRVERKRQRRLMPSLMFSEMCFTGRNGFRCGIGGLKRSECVPREHSSGSDDVVVDFQLGDFFLVVLKQKTMTSLWHELLKMMLCSFVTRFSCANVFFACVLLLCMECSITVCGFVLTASMFSKCKCMHIPYWRLNIYPTNLEPQALKH